ncbi:kinase-like protein [Aspergillus ibericus CBS 121593]|uniref:Kinase-like protein n=1 Tax=Aspergillus ibericus CBS 121593 TaxID=1448316 RepID=A0A395GLC3_9EURO|nr:kinase-like protein [Aspergillus ibericus CBS 121593]RAK96310.1 kinase-like protein [Aspergillus ibericus CBS 121593]
MMSHAQNCDIQSSSPINDSTFNRHLTLWVIAILRRIRPLRGTVLMLTDRLCVKYGEHIDLTEAATMRFIAQNTSIPVPKVHCAFTHRGCSYIVMERIQGDMIGVGWVYRSEESKTKLLTQLKKMVQEIRELRPPEGVGVSSVNGGSLFDCRLPRGCLRFGPFLSIQHFHRYLREDMELDPGLDSDLQNMMKQHDRNWPIVFTHGDLSSLNILVRGEDIVAIIDWETAGWYPSYWEYTTACQVNPQNSFWINEIDKFLTPMPDELEMERTRQKYFGIF